MKEATLLATLQHADSFFPGGASAFSWGLEAAVADGQVVDPAAVQGFLTAQVVHRWASCDRSLLVAAHRSHQDMDRVVEIDRLAEAFAWPLEMRAGSARAGGALLSVHCALGTSGATAYRRLVRDGVACGHLPVIQGALWAAVGLDATAASAVALHGLCVTIVGAALRLGCLSHIGAQRILTALSPVLAMLLREPPPDLDAIRAFTPMTDIAAMRHEIQEARLFVN